MVRAAKAEVGSDTRRRILGSALEAFAECCLPATRSWSARELLQQLDRLTATTVFMTLYREHVDSDDFPNLVALYAELGLQSMDATTLRLDATVPGGWCMT